MRFPQEEVMFWIAMGEAIAHRTIIHEQRYESTQAKFFCVCTGKRADSSAFKQLFAFLGLRTVFSIFRRLLKR